MYDGYVMTVVFQFESDNFKLFRVFGNDYLKLYKTKNTDTEFKVRHLNIKQTIL